MRDVFSLKKSVQNAPGSTIMHRIPNGLRSVLMPSVQPSSANLEALYTELPSTALIPEVELTTIVQPERCLRMNGSTARVIFIVPKILVSICWRISFSDISSKYPSNPYPALLTSTSIRPNRSKAVSTDDFTCSSFVMSSLRVSRFGELPRVFSISSGLRAVATTLYPLSKASLAIAAPRPLFAPVINHTWLFFCVRFYPFCYAV